MTPRYETNAPHGFMGDPRRGAALGRPSTDNNTQTSPKVALRRVRINTQGYDCTGSYFGIGSPIYWASDEDGTYETTFRASDREGAKRHVRERFPDARFLR